MKCTPVQFEHEGQKITAIVCGSRRPMRCQHEGCGKPTSRLCDWKMGNDKTCDMHICPEHSTQPARGKDLCLKHSAEWAERQKKAALL